MLRRPRKLSIGQFDERIEIKEFTTARGSGGGEELTYSTLATVWAKVDYNATNEKVEAARETAFNTVTFTIRYRTDITEKHKIVFQNKNYDIEAIKELNRNTYLEIIATRKDER